MESQEKEADDVEKAKLLGFSLSVSAKAAFWGFSVEGGTDHSSSSQKEGTRHSRSEQTYICSSRYHYIPTASCFFQRDQLRLSDGALRELQCIEDLLSVTQEADRLHMLKSRCASFFSRFGSHVSQGPLHFGGIFWWKASSEGFREEQREEMKQQASEALNSFVRASFSIFAGTAGGNVDVSKSSSQASLGRSDRSSSHTAIQLSVTNTGGPSETDSLAQWKCGLVASNTTWFVIDRGYQMIPVWDIIQSNHSKDFKSTYQMSSGLRAAYEALTKHSVGTVFGEELASAVEEARAFLEHVKTWEVTTDERKLLTLM
uniref:MACPF domain-containing protein n=1 Tax=Coturnix japonica TaxID=93934 RepID=A0A8C2T210_COTJA